MVRGIISKNLFSLVKETKQIAKIINIGAKKISWGLIKIPMNKKKVEQIKRINLFFDIELIQNDKEIKKNEKAKDPVKIFNEVFKEITIRTILIKRYEKLLKLKIFLTLFKKKLHVIIVSKI